ncbi:MAG: ribonuclease Z [Candidatus Methylomirabilales bacterium]
MAPTFQSFLVNDLFGDPALYVALPWERRALLFDLGEVSALPAGRLLKITDVFVSHTHIDHFVGFDHLLRVLLGRPKALRLFGPPGFIERVEGKLRGYTWNLVEEYALVIHVREIGPDRVLAASFPCREGFPRRDEASEPFDGTVLDEPLFRVRAAHLDHRIPCLGFALEERIQLNVDTERLAALGLPVGRWLSDLKRAVRDGAPDEQPFTVAWKEDGREVSRVLPLGELRRSVLRTRRGQKLAYVTDAADSSENAARILELARDADLFYCEAGYPERDAERAQQRHHLTAGRAGRLAAAAGARHLAVFHLSPKYREESAGLVAEAMAAFTDGSPRKPGAGGATPGTRATSRIS